MTGMSIIGPPVRNPAASDVDSVAAEFRREIARQDASCGCDIGAVFTLAALAVLVAHVIVADPGWSLTGAIARGAAWIVGCSLAGKVLGLTWARLRANRLRRELNQWLTSHGAGDGLEKE